MQLIPFNLHSLPIFFKSSAIFWLSIKILYFCKQSYSADQHDDDDEDDDDCLSGYRRNIRHGAYRAWRACTALWHAAQRS